MSERKIISTAGWKKFSTEILSMQAFQLQENTAQ